MIEMLMIGTQVEYNTALRKIDTKTIENNRNKEKDKRDK